MIEFGIWLPLAYVGCYRFQPSLRIMQSSGGRRFIENASDFLRSKVPSWHETLAKLASKIEGAPRTRAAGEWALLNKVLAPVSFPTKMYLAHLIVQRRSQAHIDSPGSIQEHLLDASVELASAAAAPLEEASAALGLQAGATAK